MSRLSDANVALAKEIIARYPKPKSALIPLLHLSQEQNGYITREAMAHLGELVGVTSAEALRKVTNNTRDAKLNVEDRDALRQEWRDRAAALGFDGKALVDAARTPRCSRRHRAFVDRVVGRHRGLRLRPMMQVPRHRGKLQVAPAHPRVLQPRG